MPALYFHCPKTVQSFTLNHLIIFKYLYITVLSIHVKTAYPCVYINICIKPPIKLSDLPHSVAHTECHWLLQLSAHFLPKTLCNQLFSTSLSSDNNCSELLVCCLLASEASRCSKGEFIHVRVATFTYTCTDPALCARYRKCRTKLQEDSKLHQKGDAPLPLLKCQFHLQGALKFLHMWILKPGLQNKTPSPHSNTLSER